MEKHGVKNEREQEEDIRKYNFRILSVHKLPKYVNIILMQY
jgi:hypothetical protein